MSKLLSIVIPTLNRYEYLRRTMDFVIPQVEKHLDEVDLVVCCNASKDKTDTYMKELCKEKPFIRYKYFNEYVEVGQSLIRSVGEALGEYVVLWGDDDIPMPFFADTILDIIKKNPEVGIIHCNRIEGKDTIYGFKEMKLNQKKMDIDEEGLYSIDEFVQRFGIMLGFISSCVFNRQGWLDGEKFYDATFFGYEHLSIIISGNKNRQCYYYPFPLEIQRLPFVRDFSTKWPLYRFVGVPNMMSTFDKSGVTNSALQRWQETINKSFAKFVWTIMYCSQDRGFYKPICGQLNKYQKSNFRKVLTYIIVYTMPKSFFTMIKKRLYK